MVDLKLYDLVVEAFHNATENGYDLTSMSSKDITLDMLSYHSEIENYDYFEVLAAVRRCIGEEDFR